MLAFVSCIAFVFQSLELAILLTATLGIHELGHVFAVSRFGIDWQVGFGIVGAWTSTPTDKRIALSHFANAVIHLSGPLFNLLYALLSVGIHWILGLNNDYWLRAANLSATIGLLNVLPIGRSSDGGKVIERIFSSLDEKAERWLLPAPALWLFLLLCLVVVGRYDWIATVAFATIGLWFVAGMLRESVRDDNTGAISSRAMTRNQGFLLLSSMIVLLLICTAIALLTPLWLKEEHVLGMFGGLARTVIRPIFNWLQERYQTLRALLFVR
jgi:hypothetical protein